MKIIEGISEISNPLEESVITLGSFDGLHIGHQKLMAQTIARAQKLDVPAVVITFHPHPLSVLVPERETVRIHGLLDLKHQLSEMGGIDLLVVEPFTAKMAKKTASQFFEGELLPALNPRAVVVGYDFVFGANRSGDEAYFNKLEKDLGLVVERVEAIECDGEVVSSSRIRSLLQEGQLDRVRELLGREYSITGTITRGEQRGRTIGFPTANLIPDFSPAMALGVYRCFCYVNGEKRVAVTNVGRAPTFKDNGEVTIECHLLDYSRDIYNCEMTVEFLEFIREEKKFSSADELVAQIALDVEEVRKKLE